MCVKCEIFTMYQSFWMIPLSPAFSYAIYLFIFTFFFLLLMVCSTPSKRASTMNLSIVWLCVAVVSLMSTSKELVYCSKNTFRCSKLYDNSQSQVIAKLSDSSGFYITLASVCVGWKIRNVGVAWTSTWWHHEPREGLINRIRNPAKSRHEDYKVSRRRFHGLKGSKVDWRAILQKAMKSRCRTRFNGHLRLSLQG